MSVINISSPEGFNGVLHSNRFVVADFYADWCGPCKAIAPVYESLATELTRQGHIAFVKINGDQQQRLAQTYGVRAYPTFIIFENAQKKQTIAGADPRQLNQVIQTLAAEASKSDGAAGATEGGFSGAGGSWLGAEVAKNYSDVTDQIDVKGLELLNRDNERGEARVLFDGSKPSALSGKGKTKATDKSDWVESDTDEQLMLYVPFQSTLKVHSLHITSFAEEDEDDDEAPMRPKTVSLYTNRSHVLGFDEADDIPAVQTVEIKDEDWDKETGTARVDLRFVKFQNVTSLVLFFVDGAGESEKLRVDRIRFIGDAGEKRAMGKLEKIGDEPGE